MTRNVCVMDVSVPFAKGSISVQVRVNGDAISRADLARVRKYLELAGTDWRQREGKMSEDWILDLAAKGQCR